MTSTPDRYREWDAAYVLGALSADDRRDFERHLRTCRACAGAVAELAGLPGILSALPVAEAVAGAEAVPADAAGADADAHLRAGLHQPGSVQRLAGAAVKRARRTRIRLAGVAVAAAAVIALGGGLLGAVLAGSPAGVAGPAALTPPATTQPAPLPGTGGAVPTQVVAMEPVEADALTAALTITDTDWGTRFDWSCVYLN